MGRNYQEYWGPIGAVIDRGPLLIGVLCPGVGEIVCQRRLTKLTPPGPAVGSQWIKYFAFVQSRGQLRALQVESRAVDAIPFDQEQKAYYLIRRKDSGLLATAGGFIDPQDGIGTLPLKDILRTAAARELREETGATGTFLRPLGGSIREEIASGSNQVAREHITRTWAFAALMPMQALTPADDAQQAPGSEGLLPGWYRVSDGIPTNLHFAHHAVILRRLFDEAASNFPRRQRVKRLLPYRGLDLAAAQKLAQAVEQCTFRDYDLLNKRRPTILAANVDFAGVDWLTLTGAVQ